MGLILPLITQISASFLITELWREYVVKAAGSSCPGHVNKQAHFIIQLWLKVERTAVTVAAQPTRVTTFT